MKITANKSNDGNFLEETEARRSAYLKSIENAESIVKKAIIDKVGPSIVKLDFKVSNRFGSYAIQVYSYYDTGAVDNDDVALSWKYEVRLNSDGEVTRETASWSGLKATNSTQLDSLKETVRILEILDSMNWASLLEEVNSSISSDMAR